MSTDTRSSNTQASTRHGRLSDGQHTRNPGLLARTARHMGPAPTRLQSSQASLVARQGIHQRWADSPLFKLEGRSGRMQAHFGQQFARLMLAAMGIRAESSRTTFDIVAPELGCVEVKTCKISCYGEMAFSGHYPETSDWTLNVGLTPERIYGWLYPSELLIGARRIIEQQTQLIAAGAEAADLASNVESTGRGLVVHRRKDGGNWMHMWSIDSHALTTIYLEHLAPRLP